RRVQKGVVTDEIVYLSADEEETYRIAPADTPLTEDLRFREPEVIVRYQDSFPRIKREEVDLIDLSPQQIVSVATCLIPFLENDDANRALMGATMQRQAVPLVRSQVPYVMTGIERRTALDSGAVVPCKAAGMVTEVDAGHITLRRPDGTEDVYSLLNFVRSNNGTCFHQKPLVRQGDFVRAGHILADGPCTDNGELALGRNILCAFLPFEGYNYEDAIVISDRLVHEDVFSSIHVEKYEHEARETKVGPEEFTRDIPNVGEEVLKDLDEDGVVRIGAEVRSEDILVGKVAPKGQEELTSEEKLVRAIFGEKAAEMRDASLRVPHGEKGKVVDIKRFARLRFRCVKCDTRYDAAKEQHRPYCDRCGGELVREEGDELTPGVNQLARVYVAQRRKVMEGDKMAGRHGNKGVIARIMPAEDMPFLPDGTPVDIILNPLGVPSRMNIGQIMEAHLGFAACEMGVCFENPIFQGAKEEEIMGYLDTVADRLRRRVLRDYVSTEVVIENGWYDDELPMAQNLERLAQQLRRLPTERLDELAGYLALSPEEWGAAADNEARVAILVSAIRARVDDRTGFDEKTGKCWVYNGRTGERYSQPVTVGHVYMMKLAHLVEEKIHARSTGPYSLVTQQPLGGKAQFGGQRFGEMEVWALEAYGAAYTLQEILTIKSDDVLGRVKTYESIVKGENILEPGIPESFKILIKELQSLGLQVSVESKEAEPVSLEEAEEEVLA
ncbi:DNA-directed RNA polymerase subunit beta, partial [candidate division KD3-62 bacterium DG_56]